MIVSAGPPGADGDGSASSAVSPVVTTASAAGRLTEPSSMSSVDVTTGSVPVPGSEKTGRIRSTPVTASETAKPAVMRRTEILHQVAQAVTKPLPNRSVTVCPPGPRVLRGPNLPKGDAPPGQVAGPVGIWARAKSEVWMVLALVPPSWV